MVIAQEMVVCTGKVKPMQEVSGNVLLNQVLERKLPSEKSQCCYKPKSCY